MIISYLIVETIQKQKHQQALLKSILFYTIYLHFVLTKFTFIEIILTVSSLPSSTAFTERFSSDDRSLACGKFLTRVSH